VRAAFSDSREPNRTGDRSPHRSERLSE
jgi:hypothetical protein